MTPLSRLGLAHRWQQTFHRAPAPEIHDAAWRQWLDHQRDVPRSQAKAAARTLHEAGDRRAERLDLRHLTPATIAAVPGDLIRRLAHHADELLLPDGCRPDAVMRWAESLYLSSLHAYDLQEAGPAWRDDHLPERLTIIRSNRLPVPESDLVGTHRLYDIRDRRVAEHMDAHPDRHAGASLTPANDASRETPLLTMDDLVRTALTGRDLAEWAATRPRGETFTTLRAENAARLRRTLDGVDDELLAPKAREARRLVRAWLDEGPSPRISPVRASQVALLATALCRAYTVDTVNGPALASPRQIASLQQRRLWIDDAPDLHVRTDRERLLSRELDRRAPELGRRSSITTVTPTTGRARSVSTDSGIDSGGSASREIEYINTLPPRPVYEDMGYVAMQGKQRSASPARTVDGNQDLTLAAVKGRALAPLPESGMVDAAEVALRPLRNALRARPAASRPGDRADWPADQAFALGAGQRNTLAAFLQRLGDVLPSRLAAPRVRAEHALRHDKALSPGQARDLIAVFDAVRVASSQARDDAAGPPELPARPGRPAV